jgi:hypothetical protein
MATSFKTFFETVSRTIWEYDDDSIRHAAREARLIQENSEGTNADVEAAIQAFEQQVARLTRDKIAALIATS